MADIIDVDALKQLLHQFADARDWHKYHTPKNLVMAAANEAGELLEIFQWLSEEEAIAAKNDPALLQHTSDEIADVMLYLIRLADVMQINISQALMQKMKKNAEKYPAS